MLTHVRLFFAYLTLLLASGLYSLVAIITPFYSYHVVIMSRFVSVFAKKILGVKIVTFHHPDYLSMIKGPFQSAVYVSNHQDNYDIFIGASVVPPKTVTVGKKSLLYVPFFGLMYYFTGNILIDRQNKKKALNAMGQVANVLKKNQLSVWIMPEGTRSKTQGLLPFKKGAFIAAIEAQVPIIPVAISPYAKELILHHQLPKLIHVKFLKPIPTKGMAIHQADGLKEESFMAIQNELKSGHE